MTIGKKLKKAREDASLTQQQLSSGIVTRNMLSQIENDRAKPSLDTLSAFADRLGIKLSYFLCDDDDNFAIMKESVLAKLRERMKKREYNDCLDLLYRVDIRDDDELRYISALCHYHSALDDYHCGRLKSAKESFLNAIKDAEHTVYPADTKAEEVLSDAPNGIVLSNGPGNPKDCTSQIAEVKALLEATHPLLGISLGHQLAALAMFFF